MSGMYKGVGRWEDGGMGGGGGWAAESRLYLLLGLCGVATSPRSADIDSDKPRGPKRHLTAYKTTTES